MWFLQLYFFLFVKDFLASLCMHCLWHWLPGLILHDFHKIFFRSPCPVGSVTDHWWTAGRPGGGTRPTVPWSVGQRLSRQPGGEIIKRPSIAPSLSNSNSHPLSFSLIYFLILPLFRESACPLLLQRQTVDNRKN